MNLKINELRRGNKLKHGGVVVDIDARSIFDMWDNDGITKLGYKAIQLTEDWLLRFGFEKRGKTGCSFQYFIGTNPITHDWLFDILWQDKQDYPFYRNGFHTIKYVHQLQNLYFALTGEELEFKN